MKKFRSLMAFVLCLACVLSLNVFAFADDSADKPSLVDPAELEQITRDFMAQNNINEKLFSVGYCYTATGETWYYNEDRWYYSASTYKVPLMMMLAELEAKGEITRETPIKNLPLGEAEELILTYSNNDYAHLMMSYFGTEPDCRDLYKQYSDLPDDYYDPDFRAYSYFTAHFLTDVVKVLYFENERFPNIVESLLPATAGQYFERQITDYEVAQKYGALKEFNHTTGIVYTPNPFILTVMTEYCNAPDSTIGAYAKLMEQYTLKLDEKLDAYLQELEAAEKKAAEEEARRQEELLKQQEAEEKARLEAEEKAKAEAAATPVPSAEPEKNEDKGGISGPILVAVAALMAALIVFVFARAGKKSRSRNRKNTYTPKH